MSMMIDLDEAVLEELLRGGGDDNYELVEEMPWESEHKCAYSSMIIKNRETQKHYRFGMTRRGTYWDGYEFEYDPAGEEVESKEVVVKEWVRVKK